MKKMKVKYIGPDIGIDGLFNGNTYEVVEIDELSGALRIIDESGEDYLYDPKRPRPIACEYQGGKFEIVSDKDDQLKRAIFG